VGRQRLDWGGGIDAAGSSGGAPWSSSRVRRSASQLELWWLVFSKDCSYRIIAAWGSHLERSQPVGVSERRCVMARLQLWSSMMAGGSSKGWNQLGLHQIGAARCRQAHREVAMAQNTVEWWRFVRKQRLGFSSVFAKIPHDSSLIYRGFACRSHTTRIRLRLYLQLMFEPSFGWDLVDFRLGK
jgi:hypothetical protein